MASSPSGPRFYSNEFDCEAGLLRGFIVARFALLKYQGAKMTELAKSCPQTREQVINMYFLEHRAKLLDVAAFLDRIDRAQTTPDATDFREVALKQAVATLIDGQPYRTKRVLDLLSDSTTDMPQSAHGMKGASGAVR